MNRRLAAWPCVPMATLPVAVAPKPLPVGNEQFCDRRCNKRYIVNHAMKAEHSAKQALQADLVIDSIIAAGNNPEPAKLELAVATATADTPTDSLKPSPGFDQQPAKSAADIDADMDATIESVMANYQDKPVSDEIHNVGVMAHIYVNDGYLMTTRVLVYITHYHGNRTSSDRHRLATNVYTIMPNIN